MKQHVICTKEKEITNLMGTVSRIEGKLDNGLDSRIKVIEKMQYWQLGVMVAIITGLLIGLWYLTTRTMEADAKLLQQVQIIVQQGIASAKPLLK
jgi:hypothetical protein